MLGLCRGLVAFLAGLACLYISILHVRPIDFMYSPLHDPISVNLAVVFLALFALGFISGALIVWFGLTKKYYNQNRKSKKVKPSASSSTGKGGDPSQDLLPSR